MTIISALAVSILHYADDNDLAPKNTTFTASYTIRLTKRTYRYLHYHTASNSMLTCNKTHCNLKLAGSTKEGNSQPWCVDY